MSEAAYNPDLPAEAAVVVEAMQVSQAYGIDAALFELTRYAYDAENSAQTILSIHGRYGWPVREIASVLIAVSQTDEPTRTMKFVKREPQDDLEHMEMTLPDGTHVATPLKETVHEIPIEEQLPDGWNTSYPHSTDELARRAEVAEDIAIYLATGVAELMQVESPMRMLEAAPLIERFTRYAADCVALNDRLARANQQLTALEQRRAELRDLYWTNVGVRDFGDIEIDELLRALDATQKYIVPPPPTATRRIPLKTKTKLMLADEAELERDSKEAQRIVELQAFKGLREVKVGSIALRDAARSLN